MEDALDPYAIHLTIRYPGGPKAEILPNEEKKEEKEEEEEEEDLEEELVDENIGEGSVGDEATAEEEALNEENVENIPSEIPLTPAQLRKQLYDKAMTLRVPLIVVTPESTLDFHGLYERINAEREIPGSVSKERQMEEEDLSTDHKARLQAAKLRLVKAEAFEDFFSSDYEITKKRMKWNF
eukprot:GHVP01001078.1.p3 GENE.GHVP01001078.1~~GHVP01001078.1.p3  ORF type:complete len:182 (+),score=54.33 GHVP01001078.1:466-1011(+)